MNETILVKTYEQQLVDSLTLQVTTLVRNIKDDFDTHLLQSFHNGDRLCYELVTIGSYNIIYLQDYDELVIAFRLDSDGSWGHGTYYSLDNEDNIRSACEEYLHRAGMF